jgi:ribose transport system substrate-binding protein
MTFAQRPHAARRFIQKTLCTSVAVACVAGAALAGTAQAAEAGKVGLGLPLLTSPFWQSYNNYLPKYAKDMGIDILAPVNSNGDPVQQITDMNNLLNLGSKGIVVGPLDSAAISRALDAAAAKNVPVVAVDVAPTQGKVAMVVRADNHAYGEKACTYIGEHVKSGKVVQIMGDLASVNGRDRSEAFRSCLKKYPGSDTAGNPGELEGRRRGHGARQPADGEPGREGHLHAGGRRVSVADAADAAAQADAVSDRRREACRDRQQ